jgi:twitching motility protein PilT
VELHARGATDLLLTAGAPPYLRIDGRLVTLGHEMLGSDDTERILHATLPPEIWDRFIREKEADFSFDWHGVARFRGNVFHQKGTVALSLRFIPFDIPSLEALGLPPVVSTWVDLPQGLVLVTGPSGSGKSTTQASVIDAINQRRPVHVVTIEDPIEYVHFHKRAAVDQREIGVDCDSFERALRASLREDPDVLLVGEMRDPETIQTALTIAETGHLVFATLHTNDAGQALDRIIDVFPGAKQQQVRVQLAASLTGVISQRLLPRIGGGRVAAYEVLSASFAVRNLIREGKASQLRNLIATGATSGMCTLESSLSNLVTSGVVSLEDATAISLYPSEIERVARLQQVQ